MEVLAPESLRREFAAIAKNLGAFYS